MGGKLNKGNQQVRLYSSIPKKEIVIFPASAVFCLLFASVFACYASFFCWEGGGGVVWFVVPFKQCLQLNRSLPLRIHRNATIYIIRHATRYVARHVTESNQYFAQPNQFNTFHPSPLCALTNTITNTITMQNDVAVPLYPCTPVPPCGLYRSNSNRLRAQDRQYYILYTKHPNPPKLDNSTLTITTL